MTTKRESLSSISHDVLTASKIANNTFDITYKDKTRAIRLHRTDVITYFSDGSFRLDSGGWETMTTRNRINTYIRNGFSIRQKDFTWYLHNRFSNKWYEFKDGMTIALDNSPLINCLEVDNPFTKKKRKKTSEADFKQINIDVILNTL